MRLISVRISSRSLASRLDSGSSIRTSGGSMTIARAIATRCCCPPESCPGSFSACASQLHEVERGVDLARGFRPSAHAAWRARSRCSSARSCAGRARSSGTPCRSRAAPAGARRCACSSSQMRRPRAVSSPAMQLSAVDLPQPEGPSSAMNSPRRIVRSRRSRATAAPKRRVTPSRRSSPKPSATTSSPLRRRSPGPTS